MKEGYLYCYVQGFFLKKGVDVSVFYRNEIKMCYNTLTCFIFTQTFN